MKLQMKNKTLGQGMGLSLIFIGMVSGSGLAQAPSKSAKTASPVLATMPVLSPQMLEVAKRVETGRMACELNNEVQVSADTKNAGYFYVENKHQKLHMHPVETRVHAVRLEDAHAGGVVWLQLANKSMLMVNGHRYADECMSPRQAQYAQTLKSAPPSTLLDGAAPQTK